MPRTPMIKTQKILDMANAQDHAQPLQSAVMKLLENQLRAYPNQISLAQIQEIAGTLERAANTLRTTNDNSNADTCEMVVNILDEAIGELMSAQPELSLNADEKVEATHSVSANTHAPVRKKIIPYRRPSDRFPPFDAVSLSQFITDWGTARGFLPALQKFIQKNTEPTRGQWQDIIVRNTPPLEDGTILKVGYFTTPPSKVATLYLDHESCAEHVIPALETIKLVTEINRADHNPGKAHSPQMQGYKSLAQIFYAKKLHKVREALSAEIQKQPGMTSAPQTSQVTIHPYDEDIQLRVTISSDGKTIIYFDENCERAIKDFANKIAPARGADNSLSKTTWVARSAAHAAGSTRTDLASIPLVREDSNSLIPIPALIPPSPRENIDPSARYDVSALIELGLQSQHAITQPQELEILGQLCKLAFTEYESAPTGMTFAEIRSVRDSIFARLSDNHVSGNGLAADRAVIATIDAAIEQLGTIVPISAQSEQECAEPRAKPEPMAPKFLTPKEPSTRAFENRWKALQVEADAQEMDADGITCYIADGQKQALALSPKAFQERCENAKKVMKQVGVDSPKAEKLLDEIVAAHARYHENRALGGIKRD